MVERREQIQTLYYQGKGQREIARLLGISQPAVRKHLIRLGVLVKKDKDKTSDNVTGEDMVFTLKDGQCMIITTWEKAFWDIDNYVTRCKACRGFFITKRRGQIYCCNPCSAGKPCSCGAGKRRKIIIA